MPMLSFVEKHTRKPSSHVMLYRGKDMQGKDFFAYLACFPAGLAKLREDACAPVAEHELCEYGEVIYLDFIAVPDARAEAFINRYIADSALLANGQ